MMSIEAVAKEDHAEAGYSGTARSQRAQGGRSAVDEDDDDRRSYDGGADEYD